MRRSGYAATTAHRRWKVDHSMSGERSADATRTCRASTCGGESRSGRVTRSTSPRGRAWRGRLRRAACATGASWRAPSRRSYSCAHQPAGRSDSERVRTLFAASTCRAGVRIAGKLGARARRRSCWRGAYVARACRRSHQRPDAVLLGRQDETKDGHTHAGHTRACVTIHSCRSFTRLPCPKNVWALR